MTRVCPASTRLNAGFLGDEVGRALVERAVGPERERDELAPHVDRPLELET